LNFVNWIFVINCVGHDLLGSYIKLSYRTDEKCFLFLFHWRLYYYLNFINFNGKIFGLFYYIKSFFDIWMSRYVKKSF